MITNNPAYLSALSFGLKLQNVINGTTTGLDPAIVVLGPAWASNIYAKLQVTVNAYIAANPTSTSTAPSGSTASV